MNKWAYISKSGKNPKFLYYAANYLRLITPKFLFRIRLKGRLEALEGRGDKDYILERVNYYNRLDGAKELGAKWDEESVTLKNQPVCRQKVYYFDTFQYTRWFAPTLRWKLLPGDITYIPEIPSIVKSRPLAGDNANSVLMKLNKVRHYIYVNDRKSFAEKKDMAVFRGKIGSPGKDSFKELRYRFMKMYWGHEMCDLGEIPSRYANKEWLVDKMTINQHLDYKFILALEGNDVASNLKWVMGSNSLAVMPRPTCETWFMEGRLIPNYHYVEIKPDFSDLEERLRYYIEHQDEALMIIKNANKYVEQFKDSGRENLISLLVLDKYFKHTNPEIYG